MMRPIYDERAIIIKNGVIVIGDLHIGIEEWLSERGIHIPSLTDTMLNKLIDITENHNAHSIVILGDVKHGIGRVSERERRDVCRFIYTLARKYAIHIISGNHDGSLSRILQDMNININKNKNIKINIKKGMLIGSVSLTHGHSWPDNALMKAKKLIMAHTHPTVSISDGIGSRNYPCWLRAYMKNKVRERYPECKVKEVIVMPAFNPLCGSTLKNTPVSPFFKNGYVNMEESEVYLLNGTNMGILRDFCV